MRSFSVLGLSPKFLRVAACLAVMTFLLAAGAWAMLPHQERARWEGEGAKAHPDGSMSIELTCEYLCRQTKSPFESIRLQLEDHAVRQPIQCTFSRDSSAPGWEERDATGVE